MSDLAISPIGVGATAAVDAASAMRLQAMGPASDAAGAEKIAKDFESVLLNKLMETMQQTVPESSLWGGAAGSQVQGMFWMYMSQEIADKGGIGLWKDIYRHIPGQAPAEAPAAMMEQKL